MQGGIQNPLGNYRTKIARAMLAHDTARKKSLGENLGEQMKGWIFESGKAEIGLGNAIFGISVKNYRGYRSSHPNPLLGGLFRGRLKISIPNIIFSNRKPYITFQSEALCENCPACRNSKPPLGNFRTKTKRQFLNINTVTSCIITGRLQKQWT